MRITRWDFAPGAATGWHSHSWPYFVLMLTDAVIKITAAGKVSEVTWIPISAPLASSTTY